MTDDNNRIDDLPVNAEDIPPTPEWEKAFAAYAEQQAPDLMPRILAKIQTAQEEPKPAQTTEPEPTRTTETEPTQTTEPKKQRSGLFRIITDNRRIMLTLSGVAAAVIIIGVLVTMLNSISLPKQRKTKSDNTLAVSANTPTPASENANNERDKNGGKDDDGGKQNSTPANPSNEDNLSDDPVITDVPKPDEKNEPQEEEPPQKLEIEAFYSGSKSLKPVDLSSKRQYTLSDVTLAGFTIPTEGAEEFARESGPVYRVISNGQKTNIIVIWDGAVAGQTYSELTLTYDRSLTVGREIFTIFRVVQ